MDAEKSLAGEPAPPLMVRIQGSGWSLPAGPSYVVGRDPDCDIVIADGRLSGRHALLLMEGGHWVLADNGSTNGIYANDRRVSRVQIDGPCLVRLGHPFNGPALICTVSSGHELRAVSESTGSDDGPLEIPYAIRWLVPKGERFANFDILNDNDTQLDYYRRFGHIYAVGVPTKKWRLVVVSDPALLDEVAADEAQFGKRVEEINFFAQLSNSRGTGISVIGDGEHYDQIRRVMLPWYAPSHQRTQLERMKDQARKLAVAWAALPAGTSTSKSFASCAASTLCLSGYHVADVPREAPSSTSRSLRASSKSVTPVPRPFGRAPAELELEKDSTAPLEQSSLSVS